MTKDSAVVAIYNSHAGAETAIKELQKSGFDMMKLSIVGRDYNAHERVIGFYNSGDRMKYWWKAGAFWGGIWGMLLGSAFFMVPGIGPLVVAGPLIAWIVAALEGAVVVGGLSVIGAGFYSLGIPKESILRYETAIKSDKFVLVAHCSMKESTHARAIINRTPTEGLEQHQPLPESEKVLLGM